MNLTNLLEDYYSKLSTVDLQSKYDLSWKKLTKILKENNVYLKNNSLFYSVETEKFIKDNYFIMGNKEIASKIDISEDGVRVSAKRMGLPLKGKGWKYNSSVANLDTNTNEFFYFLGWMAADGNISKNFQSIKLSITDREILERFKIIFPTAKIYHIPKEKQKDMYCFYIGSTQLGQYLNSLGITPNKSKTLDVSDNLWSSHFVRGFFEGDGHVRKTKLESKYTRYSIGFVCGSEIFIYRLSKFFSDNNILVKIVKENTFFRLNIEGKEKVKLFYSLIYKDCDKWYLSRKKQILDQLFSNE